MIFFYYIPKLSQLQGGFEKKFYFFYEIIKAPYALGVIKGLFIRDFRTFAASCIGFIFGCNQFIRLTYFNFSFELSFVSTNFTDPKPIFSFSIDFTMLRAVPNIPSKIFASSENA